MCPDIPCHSSPAVESLAPLEEDDRLFLNDSAALLGLSPLTLQTLAMRKAYGLKSHTIQSKRYFRVGDLRAYLRARNTGSG